MKKIITILLFVFFASSIYAQSINLNQGNIAQKEYLQKIPYRNINGKLFVPVDINGKTYNFVFDTGAPLVISHKLYQELNPKIIGKKNVEDASGRKKEMTFISLPVLNLQEITFIDTPGFVTHEASSDYIDAFDCFEIDGIIGSNMLRNSVVQFDEQNKQIIITNDFKNLTKKDTVYRYQKMKLSSQQSNPFIKIGLQKDKQRAFERVLFDTGDAAFYTMSTGAYNWFNKQKDIVSKIAESEGSFGWSVHGWDNKQNHLLLHVSELHLNNQTTFNDVVVTTTHGPSRIGSKLFQYGKVTLDYKKKRFYFESFDNTGTNKLSEGPWSILPTWQNDKPVVGIIWDKALESQINLGDEILSVDGIDTRSFSPCDLANFKNSSKEKRILELRDINTEEIKTVEIRRIVQ